MLSILDMDESVEGERTVFLHILHRSDEGIVLYVECQFLIEVQLILLHTLNPNTLQLQPAWILLLLVEWVEI